LIKAICGGKLENQPIEKDINTLIARRYEELEEIKSKGIRPFEYEFDTDSFSKQIKDNYESYVEKTVKIAGRLMAIRKMGKASFAQIQDRDGKIQIYLKRDELNEMYDIFKLLDIGDIIGVEGFVFKTRTEEISVHTTSLTLLAKSLRPIPIAKEIIDEDGNEVAKWGPIAEKTKQFVDKYRAELPPKEAEDYQEKFTAMITLVATSFRENSEFWYGSYESMKQTLTDMLQTK